MDVMEILGSSRTVRTVATEIQPPKSTEIKSIHVAFIFRRAHIFSRTSRLKISAQFSRLMTELVI